MKKLLSCLLLGGPWLPSLVGCSGGGFDDSQLHTSSAEIQEISKRKALRDKHDTLEERQKRKSAELQEIARRKKMRDKQDSQRGKSAHSPP